MGRKRRLFGPAAGLDQDAASFGWGRCWPFVNVADAKHAIGLGGRDHKRQGNRHQGDG